MRQVAKDSGRPVWFLLTDRSYDPQRWRRLMDGVRAARADNLPLYAQVAGRPVGLTLGLTTSLNPFALREGFAALAKLPPAEMLARLRDPETRRLDPVAGSLAAPAGGAAAAVAPDRDALGPHVSRWASSRTTSRRRSAASPPWRRATASTPAEYCYDYLTGGDGSRMVYFPVTNYVHGDLEVVRELIEDPHTILGLSDGGAHCGVICDASLNTSMLTHWVRDRTRGPAPAAGVRRSSA